MMARQRMCSAVGMWLGPLTFFGVAWLVACLPMGEAHGASVVRKAMDPGVMIALKGGRTLYLECRTPQGKSSSAFLKEYLANPAEASRYTGVSTVPLMYGDLKPSVQRKVMETMFPKDFSSPEGWWHSVTYDGSVGVETWWNLAEWLTGKGTNYKTLEALSENREARDAHLSKGQLVFIPKSQLLPEFQKVTPDHSARLARLRAATPPPPPKIEEEEAYDATYVEGDLQYGSDGQGQFASYKLKKGEALYTNVVIRFTEFREVDLVNDAAREILKRSDISNARRIHVGQEIRIPQDMLSDRYLPQDSERRQAFEESHAAAEELRPVTTSGTGLKGVVIVLDPGHGGSDQGTYHGNLFEDELSYDIAIRIKRLLETTTQARVYITMLDKSDGEKPSNEKRFRHDDDEVVLTSPNYAPNNTRVSANLRWYLANDIYRKERALGTKEDLMLFASIHCDALYEKLRGTMVYVPGAAYREENESPPSDGIYNNFKEAREHRSVKFTRAELRRDEALSRSFAMTFLGALQRHDPQIAVHRTSDPIRNVIQRTRTKRYLPTVLRNTLIPTKVLIETANLKNDEDRDRLSDPEWRQWYAEAFVDAVQKHFS